MSLEFQEALMQHLLWLSEAQPTKQDHPMTDALRASGYAEKDEDGYWILTERGEKQASVLRDEEKFREDVRRAVDDQLLSSEFDLGEPW